MVNQYIQNRTNALYKVDGGSTLPREYFDKKEVFSSNLWKIPTPGKFKKRHFPATEAIVSHQTEVPKGAHPLSDQRACPTFWKVYKKRDFMQPGQY